MFKAPYVAHLGFKVGAWAPNATVPDGCFLLQFQHFKFEHFRGTPWLSVPDTGSEYRGFEHI